MAVVPSGKVTKEGKTIWKAAPTQTDVQKEVSEKRVQTFSSGGEKLSDTQRVAISSGGETKWVTPEKAMRIEPIGTLKYQEAERKKVVTEKLANTIRERLSQEIPESEQEGIKLLSEVKYYRTPTGTVTYRAGMKAPPTGSVEISKREYEVPESITPRPTEYLLREIMPSGEKEEFYTARKGLQPSMLMAQGYAIQQPEQEEVEKSYWVGRIPEKGTRIVTEEELNREQRNKLEFIGTGLPTSFIEKEYKKGKVKNKLGLIMSGISPLVFEREGYYQEPIASKVGTTSLGFPKLTGNELTTARYGATTYIAGLPKQKEESWWNRSFADENLVYASGQFYGEMFDITKTALYTPMPQQAKQAIKEKIPIRKRDIILYGEERTRERLSPKGIAETAIFASWAVPTFAAGGWAIKTLAKGTKIAKYLPLATKVGVSGIGALWVGGHVVSGATNIAMGEEPGISVAREVSMFEKEALTFGAVGLGYRYAIKGAKNIRKTYIPQKLPEAELRFGRGKKGTKAEITQLKLEQGKPITKWFWEGKPKARKNIRFDVISDITSKIGENAFGTIRNRFIVQAKVKGGRIELGKVIKSETPIIKEIVYGELDLGKLEFAKRPSEVSVIYVKGYKRLQISPIELLSVDYTSKLVSPKEYAKLEIQSGRLKGIKYGFPKYESPKLYGRYNELVIGVFRQPNGKLISKTTVAEIQIAKGLPKTRIGKLLTGKPTVKEILTHELLHGKALTEIGYPEEFSFDVQEAWVRKNTPKFVKGFEVELPKLKRYPYVSAKDVIIEPYIKQGAKISYKYTTMGLIPEGEPLIRYGEAKLIPTTRKYVRKPPVVSKEQLIPSTYSAFKLAPKGAVTKVFKEVSVTTKKFDIGELNFKDITGNVFIDTSIPEARQIALQRLEQSTNQITTKKIKPVISYKETSSLNKALTQISKLSVPTFAQRKMYPYVGEPYEQGGYGGQKLMTEAGLTLAPELRTKPTFGYIKGGVIGLEKERQGMIPPIVNIIRETKAMQRKGYEQNLVPITDITQAQKPIVDITQIQEQGQERIIVPITKTDLVTDLVTERPRPSITETPWVPGGVPWFPPLDFLGGEGIFRGRKPLRQPKAYTPDFIASVLNQFGKAPRQRMFTGQERRYKIKGRRTISPLPEVSNGGIFGLIKTQLGG